uniref:Phospholipase A2 n=1 Tax=Rhabditophanes sp. KR3021 TaxID=114890 RepID=A0AC35TXJ3_9BILA
MALRLQDDNKALFCANISEATGTSTEPEDEGTVTPPSSPVLLTRHNSKPSLFSLASVAVKLSDLWTTAKDKLLGEDYWIPADSYEVVYFPDELLSAHETLYPDSEDTVESSSTSTTIRIVQGTIKNEPTVPLHHVVYSYKMDDPKKAIKTLSLYRSRDLPDALDFYRRTLECEILLTLIDKTKDCRKKIRDITIKFQEKPLWRAIHIAIACQRADIFLYSGMDYLKTKDFDIEGLMNVLSLPEGKYPLMLAIETNQENIVRKLLEHNASVTAVDMSGNNALHYAALTSVGMIELVLQFSKSKDLINSLNNDSLTPLLLAIRNANPLCMTALLKRGAELSPKGSGKNALFEAIASKGKGQDVIKSILEAQPNLLFEKDATTGNTVVHVATHKNPLSNLLYLKGHELNLNILNNAGQSPLHIFTNKGDLGMIMTISSYNCDLNIPNGNGDTALHIAVSNRYLEVTRLLLSLGADANVYNRQKDTPRHVAAKLNEQEILKSLIICEALRCPTIKEGCVSGCVSTKGMGFNIKSTRSMSKESLCTQKIIKIEDLENGISSFVSAEETNFVMRRLQDSIYANLLTQLERMEAEGVEGNYINILTLDGGGIRGLLLIQALLYIEHIMGESIAPYFDWCAGTSTGALIASGLAQGKTLRECQLIYLRLKDIIFDGWVRPYNTNNLEAFIKKESGEDTKLGDLKWPRLMFPTVRADCFPVQLEFMRNYQLPLTEEENVRLGYTNPDETHLWKALRRSSAAPTYFSCVDNTYIDGGIISNNPTSDLISEVEMWNNANKLNGTPERCVKIGCLLSVGTGVIPTIPLDPSNMEISANPLAFSVAIKTLGVMLVEQVTATDGAIVDRGQAWCTSIDVPFFRLSAPLFKDIAMDTKDDLELSRMMWESIEYYHSKRECIVKLCALLKKIGMSAKRRHFFDSSVDGTTIEQATQTDDPPTLPNNVQFQGINTT